MRPWLFEFMAKWCREWNMVQDAWWWNHTTAPTVHCQRKYGLMRPSLKACVWVYDGANALDDLEAGWKCRLDLVFKTVKA
jgi:hypothetical protein